MFLLAATVAALIWANVSPSTYESVWTTDFSLHLGDHVLAADLRHWVNDGLMTFFFFVVGLEARREFDMGELRERSRISLPVLAGIGGMLVPVLLYLAFNASSDSAGGWGTAMSTDTAFALGVLGVVSRNVPSRLRVFLLTVAVVDDVIALVVIAVAYTSHVDQAMLGVGALSFGVVLLVRAAGVQRGLPYLALGLATWVAVLKSGVDPVIVGLAMGLLTSAYPAPRAELEQASELFRSFREQP